MTAMPALAVTELSHRYGDRDALNGISFTVAHQEIFGLLGPNGGGKTTLFKIVTTLLPARPGCVRILGHDVAVEGSIVRRHMGVVFQAPALDSRLTVIENLRAHEHLYDLSGRTLDERTAKGLALVRLEERRRDLVATLSGGMKRRVELAKALLTKPRILVMDEPSTGLDPGARHDMWDHLLELRRRQETTIVLTTHLMDEAARCDRVAVLHEGRLVATGAPAELTAAIGGDVILVAGPDLQGLANRIAARFSQSVEVLDGRVRLERPRGHEFVTDLVEAFPGQIDAVTFGKPTLEDVFLHHTGKRLE
jgi:ABC-2 type transport system ATP-binding protein